MYKPWFCQRNLYPLPIIFLFLVCQWRNVVVSLLLLVPQVRQSHSDSSIWRSADHRVTARSESVDLLENNRKRRFLPPPFRSHWSINLLPNFCICFHFSAEDSGHLSSSSSSSSSCRSKRMQWGKVQSLIFIFIKTSSSAGVAGNVIWGSFIELDCVGFTCTLVSLGLCCITTSHLKAMPMPSKCFVPFHSTPFFSPSLWKPSCHCVVLVLHATLCACLFCVCRSGAGFCRFCF